MTTVGERLQAARVAKNLEIADISSKTRIRPGYLEALEQDAHDRLPSPFYARLFLRQYATVLGLDPDAAVESFGEEFSDENPSLPIDRDRKDDSSRSSVFSRTGVRIAIALVIALALAGAGTVRWWDPTGRLRSFLGFEQEDSGTPPAPASAETLPAAVPPEVPEPEPVPAQPEPERIEVEVQALELLWLSASIDGSDGSEALLKAGERKLMQANELIQLTLGDASAASVLLNGKQQPDLGEPGQVRRIRFTADGLEFLGTSDP